MAKALARSLWGGVASEDYVASSVGAWVLSRGGNAIDAAVAVSLALAVTIPHLGGIGGDYFALIRSPEGKVVFINGSGQAPRRLSVELLRSRGFEEMPERGPLSIAVPGMVGGLHYMWKRYGSLEWRELVEPSIRLAREGFPTPGSLARSIEMNREILEADPGSRSAYLPPPKPGDTIKFPGLAKLLECISEDPRCLYESDPADKIAEYLESRGGVLSAEDLKEYAPLESEPLRIEYRGWNVWEMPPNTQGITTLHILMQLEDRDLPAEPLDRFPVIYEAAVLAHWIRDKYVGDPKYMPLPASEMLSREFLEKAAGEARLGGIRAGTSGDTTFYTVVDREGTMLLGIQSLFYPFGSGLTEPTYQVTLNARAGCFTLEERLPNTVAPGKRPLNTLSAVILESPEGDRVIGLGLSGGHLRPQMHAMIVTSIIDHGYDVVEAINAPRAAWMPGTSKVVVDRGYASQLKVPKGLTATEGRVGVASASELRGRLAILATDFRGEGVPVAGIPH